MQSRTRVQWKRTIPLKAISHGERSRVLEIRFVEQWELVSECRGPKGGAPSVCQGGQFVALLLERCVIAEEYVEKERFNPSTDKSSIHRASTFNLCPLRFSTLAARRTNRDVNSQSIDKLGGRVANTAGSTVGPGNPNTGYLVFLRRVSSALCTHPPPSLA